MEVREFFKEYKRMCANHPSCSDDKCPLETLCDRCDYFVDVNEQLIAAVEKWAAEHPRKTILQDFLEKYPDAKLKSNGTPYICLKNFGFEYQYCQTTVDCVACWNRLLEDVKHEG